MIRSLHVDNFGSLVDFRLPPRPHRLGGFTCLVGLNGSGKSTVLQALGFIGRLASGDVEEWLRRRDWKATELTNCFRRRQLIRFELEIDAPGIGLVTWAGAFDTAKLRCTAETVTVDGGKPVLQIADGRLHVAGATFRPAITCPLRSMQYTGSALSLIDASEVHAALAALKRAATSLRSVGVLDPRSMRRLARGADDIGYGGESLGAYVHGMGAAARDALNSTMRRLFPPLRSVETSVLPSGLKELWFLESYAAEGSEGAALRTSSSQASDSLLRVLAILSQGTELEPADDQAEGGRGGCVLFDEIENGLNPDLLERLVKLLLDSPRQIVVTTQSPMVLDALSDEVAEQAVTLLYRNAAGHTKAVRLFDLPSARGKLRPLGPGEVFLDARLENLAAEADALADDDVV